MTKLRGNPWAILVALCLGFFMTLLDLTIVNIAIPNMMDKLEVSYDEVLWVLNAYALVLVVLLITCGRLGDIRGKRNLYIAGVAVFTLASLLCGLSQDATQLIAARAFQGLGAAMLMPQTMSILIGVFPAERRGAALGVWGAVAGVATIAGPTLGGFLVSAFDWRWIFFVNLPVGVLVLVVAPLLIPADEPVKRRHSFDVRGVVLASVALFCVSFGLEEGQRYDWGQVWSFVSIPLLLAVGVVLFVVFLFAEKQRQDREPLVPFGLFRDRDYALSNIASVALSIGLIGMGLSFTIYLQSVLDMSALAAGLTMAPMSLVSAIMAPIAGRLSDRIGGKFIVFTGLTVFTVGMSLVGAMAEVGTSRWVLMPGLLVMGLGMGCTFAPLATVAMHNVRPQLAGAASGMLNTVRQLGTVVATAAIGALLQNRLAANLTAQASERAGDLPQQARAPFVEGFRQAASAGLRLGSDRGGAVSVPPGTPPEDARRIGQAAHAVFTHGFVGALHTTLVLPVVVLLLGALSCLFMTGRRKVSRGLPAGPPAPAASGVAR